MIPSLLSVKRDVVHGGRFRIIGRWKGIFFSKEYFSIFKIYIYRSFRTRSALISFVSRLDLFPFEKKFWFSETNDILIEPSCDKNEIFAETAMKIWRDEKIKILLNNRIQDGVYSTFSYPVVYITRITRSRMIDLYGTSIHLETTSTWQLRLYTWIKAKSRKDLTTIFRDIWSSVEHVRRTIFRFISHASNLHAATSIPIKRRPP